MEDHEKQLPPEMKKVGEALEVAMKNELERKRKLGHYYAWVTEDGVELIGPDAPEDDGK